MAEVGDALAEVGDAFTSPLLAFSVGTPVSLRCMSKNCALLGPLPQCTEARPAHPLEGRPLTLHGTISDAHRSKTVLAR